jgi:hypothetical protein
VRKLFIIASLLFVLPIPVRGQTGAYNTISGLFWCRDEISCLHEQAHYIDFHNGMISDSEDFRNAVTVYIFVGRKYHYIGMPMREIYATVYAESGGAVPDLLNDFYIEIDGEFSKVEVLGGSLYYGLDYARN